MKDVEQSFAAQQDISILRPHPRNPRRGDLDVLRESIRTNGFYGVVVAQTSTHYVLAGNHRVEAARLEGYTNIPVMWIDCDDKTAARILLVDNRANDKAYYDDSELLSLLHEFDMGDLLGTGWTDYGIEQLEKIVNQINVDPPEMEQEEPPELPEPPPEPDEQKPPKHTCPECGHGWG